MRRDVFRVWKTGKGFRFMERACLVGMQGPAMGRLGGSRKSAWEEDGLSGKERGERWYGRRGKENVGLLRWEGRRDGEILLDWGGRVRGG